MDLWGKHTEHKFIGVHSVQRQIQKRYQKTNHWSFTQHGHHPVPPQQAQSELVVD